MNVSEDKYDMVPWVDSGEGFIKSCIRDVMLTETASCAIPRAGCRRHVAT